MYQEIFSRTELLLGNETMKRIARQRVILFGVGGGGSWCAESLVRSGIRQLTIVDSDRVCITNINRQLMATSSTVGEVKVEVLKERLHRFRWDGASPIALVFGNEVMGVEQAVIDRCDGVIEIPQAGTKHSLNIAVSAGMVLWEMYKQHLEAQASGQTASDQETSNQNLQP